MRSGSYLPATAAAALLPPASRRALGQAAQTSHAPYFASCPSHCYIWQAQHNASGKAADASSWCTDAQLAPGPSGPRWTAPCAKLEVPRCLNGDGCPFQWLWLLPPPASGAPGHFQLHTRTACPMQSLTTGTSLGYWRSSACFLLLTAARTSGGFSTVETGASR